MKNMRWLVILGLLAMVMASMPALADMETTVHGEIRMRAENVENYFDFDDNDGDDSFSFAPFRVRLGVGVSFGDKVYGYVSIQEGDIFGKDDTIKQAGDGLNETDQDNGELILYQGYIKMNEVGGTSLSLKFGRQEYTQGNEFLFGDLDFYNGTSLDGVRGRWDLDMGPLDVVWFRTDEDLFGDDDTDILGVNWLLTDIVPDGDLEFYAYNVDSTMGSAHLEYVTLGVRAGQDGDGESGFVWSAELAIQNGDVEFMFSSDEDISALGGEGMFGYDMATDSGVHRFFGTLYYTSGDDDSSDNDQETFMAPFQDFHGRNGAADMFNGMGNLTSISLGWDYQGEKHGLSVQVFNFTASEKDSTIDLSNDSGLPADFDDISIDDEDDLGTEFDIIYTYQVNEYFGFEAGVALFQPGDAIDDLFDEDDDITRIWGQARLRF